MKITLNELVKKRTPPELAWLWEEPKWTFWQRISIVYYSRVTYNIRTVCSSIKDALKNLWLLKHVWQFRPWDAAYSYRIMYDMYSAMIKDFERGNAVMDNSRSIKSMKICREACKRLGEMDNPNQDVTEKSKLFSDRYVIMTGDNTKGPRETLANEIKRNGGWWW